ncbi:MAG: quinone-interacting membrane-bound oxidoreductase complex subunit QmoC [Desulfovibrionales bacterium]
MANAVRIEPDLGFVKELQAVGGESLKKCYQCATCSVVCPLSPGANPYPRKEMVWAQWGLKDRLVNDIDIWLCHNCGTCSDLCPRGANPGDLLAALRNMAYKNLAPLKIVGTWMSSIKYLPILVAIPAVLFLIVWAIRAGQLGTWLPLVDGKVIYGALFPGDFTIDPIFGLVALFVAFCFYKGVTNLLNAFKDQPKTFVIGYKRPGLAQAFLEVVKDEIATHKKWKDCGESESDQKKFQGHLALFYGFVALFIVTSIVALGHWGGKVVPFIEPIGHTPMPLWSPVKILANVGSILLLVGLTFLTKRRMNQNPSKHGSSYYDWFLLGVIWAVTITGIGAQVLRLAQLPAAAYITYYVHLITVFMLIAYLPWSKLGHLVYRTVALAYARHSGRLPMGK